MLTQQQQHDRKKGLGGSDAASVLGISPWKTGLELYLEKTGQAPPVEMTEAMEWGSRLEGAVADAAADRLGIPLNKCEEQLIHPEYPWMLANLDREIPSQRTIVEIKTTGFRDEGWGEPGTDEIPPHYLAQVAHYMAVRDYNSAIVPVLFMAERKLEIYQVSRDPELEAMLIQAESRFWNENVLKRQPPEPVTNSDMHALWPTDSGNPIYASAEVLETVERLQEVKGVLKKYTEEKATLETAIKGYMADHTALMDEDKVLATWKEKMTKRLDTKALSTDHPDLTESYRKESRSRVFLLK